MTVAEWLTRFWPTVLLVTLAILGSRNWRAKSRRLKTLLFALFFVLLIIQGSIR